jgi:hypothetical protein
MLNNLTLTVIFLVSFSFCCNSQQFHLNDPNVIVKDTAGNTLSYSQALQLFKDYAVTISKKDLDSGRTEEL